MEIILYRSNPIGKHARKTWIGACCPKTLQGVTATFRCTVVLPVCFYDNDGSQKLMFTSQLLTIMTLHLLYFIHVKI